MSSVRRWRKERGSLKLTWSQIEVSDRGSMGAGMRVRENGGSEKEL